MCRVNAPPVVDEYVEDRQDDNKERSWPLRLEPNSNHTACSKANQWHNETRERPLALNHKPKEKENEQHTTYELEAVEDM
jgi:hypothetical protein